MLKANGIKLLTGNDFRMNDTGKVLINQTLAKRLGLDPLKAPGTRLYSQYDKNPVTYVEIAGVMKDFNYNSLHSDIRPFMFVYNNDPQQLNVLVVSVSSKNYSSLLAGMEAVWHKKPAINPV